MEVQGCYHIDIELLCQQQQIPSCIFDLLFWGSESRNYLFIKINSGSLHWTYYFNEKLLSQSCIKV